MNHERAEQSDKLKENLEDDLNWLIQDSAEHGDKVSQSSVQAKAVTGNEHRHTPDGHVTTTDEETDDDSGLTTEERNLLLRNTLLNDATEGEEYDVKHRLEEANKALASEGIEEEDRERRVIFKPRLVDLEVPPDDSSSSSSSSEDEADTNVVRKKMKDLALDQPSPTVEINGQVVRRDEKVLVERGGKFELVEAGDLNGMLAPGSPQSQTSNLPPIKPRPKSAPVKHNKYQSPHRPVSANDQLTRPTSRNHGRPFSYSPETKEMMKKRAALKAQRDAEEEKRRKAEEELARQEAEDAWKSWVERKNDEIRRQKKFEQEKSKKRDREAEKEEERREAEEAYKDWLKQKRLQTKMERIVTQQQQIEHDEGWYLRERRDCNRAFRIWLRNKNDASKKLKEQEQKLRKQSLREMRRARKTQKLMASIREAQQMKYVEYYGYRI